MKLGFLTAPFPDTPLMDVADWAASEDFEVLEIACWPQSSGATRKYAGTSHIDVANLTDSRASEIKAEIAAKGLDISGLGFYPNPLHPDPEARQAAIDHLKAVIVATGKMGLPVTNTFCGGDAARPWTRTGKRHSGSGPTSSASPRTTGSRSPSRTAP